MTRRDVPNTYTQQAAGQNQRVRTADQNFNLGWQSIFTPTSLLDVVGFARFSKFKLTPSPNDTPVIATSDRTLNNYGVTPSFTWTNTMHGVKIGAAFKRYPIREHLNRLAREIPIGREIGRRPVQFRCLRNRRFEKTLRFGGAERIARQQQPIFRTK